MDKTCIYLSKLESCSVNWSVISLMHVCQCCIKFQFACRAACVSLYCQMLRLRHWDAAGLRHSLRPKRPPSYPLKEESPPPQAPPRQHHSGSRQGQGSSRTSSGQSQKAQAAATRPTQKVRHNRSMCRLHENQKEVE